VTIVSEVTVSVRDLERRFGEFVAVDRVSFDVASGEVFGFLGPNGSGKSTTIRMLTGLLMPSGGTGRVAGFDIRTESDAIKDVIGYMSQKFSLYEDLTVGQNLDFYAGIYRVPKAKKIARQQWALEIGGLSGQESRLTGDLAGGWRQRLALACAVMHEPRILFLDEPTSGVDPISRRNFWDLIHTLARRGVTVFVTTHYMDEAEYCDRLALIHRGRLIAQGSPDALKRERMIGHVLEVAVERPVDALRILSRAQAVREVAVFGSLLHVVVADAARDGPAVRDVLERAALRVQGIERITPSLEDVFVSAIQHESREP
jgi:ABC-2 type transport system ATP-binding protein